MSLFSDPSLYLSFSFRPFSLLVMKVDSLTSLGLRSLQEISEGSVYISNNTNLCYQHTLKWHQIFTGSQIKRRRSWNDIKFNRPASQCGKMNGILNCFFCMYCTHSNVTDSCDLFNMTFCLCVCVLTEAEGHVCDPLCSNSGCWGPGPDQCLFCRNHSRHNTCIAQCNIFSGSVCARIECVNEYMFIPQHC